jgi:23S rRNA (uracil1939-C5)-methyltransferase
VLNDGSVERSGSATVHVGGFHYRLTADSFFQANRFLLGAFIAEVVEQASPASQNVLELYAGSGFFSNPAGTRRKRKSLRSNLKFVACATGEGKCDRKPNVAAQVSGGAGGCHHSRSETQARRGRSGSAARGLRSKKLLSRLRCLKPERIVYVSCNPATFAREAGLLSKLKYGLQRLTLVDQFPIRTISRTVGLFRTAQLCMS